MEVKIKPNVPGTNITAIGIKMNEITAKSEDRNICLSYGKIFPLKTNKN